MKFELVAPILGFEDLKEVELEKIDDIFMKMKSNENKYVSFTLIDPFVLRDYDFEVTQATQDLLSATEESNLLILNIVLMQTPIEDSVVNFIGPIIFNTDNNKVAQVVLPDSVEYGVAEKISTFLNAK